MNELCGWCRYKEVCGSSDCEGRGIEEYCKGCGLGLRNCLMCLVRLMSLSSMVVLVV